VEKKLKTRQAASEALKKAVAEFMHRLYKRGLTTTSGGNISIRDHNTIAVTPSASDKGTMQPEEVGLVDPTGNIIGHKFKPSIETGMHLAIYQAREDVSAVIHAHPVFCSLYSATEQEINHRLLSETYAIIGRIEYIPYYKIGSPELAEAVAEASRKADCIIMRNHGALAVGTSLLQAYDRLEVLESAAKINWLGQAFPIGTMCELPQERLKELDQIMGR
jgi:L-fuculose-phosphate aldolase